MNQFVTRMSGWAYKQASIKNLLTASIVFLIFSLFIIPPMVQQVTPSGEPVILDVQFGFTPDEAYATLATLESHGRKNYMIMLAVIDSVYPFVYGMLLILAASYFLKKALSPDNVLRLLNIIAVDAIIFDLLENISIIYLLSHFPERVDLAATLASVFGMIKWGVIALSIGVIIGALTGWVVQLRKSDYQQDNQLP